MDLKETGWKGLGCSPVASEGQVAGSCDHDNEYSTHTQTGEFLNKLRNYVLLKKDYVPRSQSFSQSAEWSVGRSVSLL